MPDVPEKFAGVPTEPVLLGLVVAVMGAVILPWVSAELQKAYPTTNKWVIGAIWFVAGALVAVYGHRGTKGLMRAVALGVSIAFFIGAFLQWAGWTFSK